jgi:hypothetical protein
MYTTKTSVDMFSLNILYLHKSCKWDWTQVMTTLVKYECRHMQYILTELILAGDENFTPNQNIEIFSVVYSFIRSTQRFN